MIIFDTKNNNGGLSKGTLYLSMLDIDYIVAKYGREYLKNHIAEDYVESFIEELEKIEKDNIFSIQYYAVLQLGIETEKDEKLLELILEEIKNENICTKKELQSLTVEEVEKRLSEMEYVQQNTKGATLDEIYRYRTYKMVKFIIKTIHESNKLSDEMYEARNRGNIGCFKRLFEQYNRNVDILTYIGLSSDIFESDYFDRRINECRL